MTADPSPAPTDVTRLALRPAEAAKALGISPRLLWAKTNSGEIPHVRIGHRVVYPIPQLQKWLAVRAAAVESEAAG